MNDRIEGIILKQTDYRENDALITVLLRTGKKVNLTCKGVKKLASKNAMSIIPFLTSEFIFNYNDAHTIFNLKSALVLKNRKNINKNLLKISIANIMCQMADYFIFEDEHSALKIYKLLDFSLDNLNILENNYLIGCFFCAKFLEIIGIKPHVDSCVFDDSKHIAGIAIKDGGFVCRNCLKKVSFYEGINENNLKNFRMINKADYDDFKILLTYDNFTYQDLFILLDFYQHHLDIKLNAYRFLKELV